jgi:hypothetical protein
MAGNDKMPGWLESLKASGFGQFLGSDVYVGYTARYVWQANQLGHFALGFAIGHLLYWICVGITWLVSLTGWFAHACTALVNPCQPIFGFLDVGWIPLAAIGLFVLLYFGKEYADFLLAKHTYGATFPLDAVEMKRIRCDGIVDAGFVALGALLVLIAPPAVFVPLIVGGAIAYLVRNRELGAKDYLDRVNLPFFYALPVFVRDLNRDSEREEQLAAAIRQFARGAEGAAEHLLIAGPKGSGKTCLGAGIGAELALNAKKVLFHTYTALLEANPAAVFNPQDEYAEDGRPNHWELADVGYVIIDEVPPAWTADEVEPILGEISAPHWSVIKKTHTVWIIPLPTLTPGGAQPPRDVEVIKAWGEAIARRLSDEPAKLYEPTKPVVQQRLPWIRLTRPEQKGAPRLAPEPAGTAHLAN